PTGSRRIMLVWPARYSLAAAPPMQRAAPAKNRKQSAIAGISSPNARAYGLPQFSDSRRANSAARSSIASASLSSIFERSAGVVSDQVSNARLAAETARLICSNEASRTSTSSSPVAGFSTRSASPSPATNCPSISSSVGYARDAALLSPISSPPVSYGIRTDRSAPRGTGLVGARQVVREHDRHEGQRDDHHRDDVGHRSLARAHQLLQHPDRQRRLLARRERRHDDLVERECERQQAACQQRAREVGKDDVAEGLERVGAEVHRRFDQRRARAAQPRHCVVVDD